MPRQPRNQVPEQVLTRKQKRERLQRRASGKLLDDIEEARGVLRAKQLQYKALIADIHRLIAFGTRKHKTVEGSCFPSHYAKLTIPYHLFCVFIASIPDAQPLLKYYPKTKKLIGTWLIHNRDSTAMLLGKMAMAPSKWVDRDGKHNKDPNAGSLAGGFAQIQCDELFSVSVRYNCLQQLMVLDYYAAAFEWMLPRDSSEVRSSPIHAIHITLKRQARMEAAKQKEKQAKGTEIKNKQHHHNTRNKNWKNGEQYDIEKILDHKKGKSGIQFLVKWAGWSDKHASWVKEEDMMARELMLSYLLGKIN